MTAKEYLNQARHLDALINCRLREIDYPGCPRLTDGRFCEEHEKLENQRYEKYDRDPAVKRKYGRAWKRIRDRYMNACLLYTSRCV